MKLTIDNALSVIRTMVEEHFQECESFNGFGEYKYLADTDHETIKDFMEEMMETFDSLFMEDK